MFIISPRSDDKATQINRKSNQFELVSGPAPIEAICLPADLDGSQGTNRAPSGRAQIAADNDVDAIKAWLARYVDTKTTLDNYRKEAERLRCGARSSGKNRSHQSVMRTGFATRNFSAIHSQLFVGSQPKAENILDPTRAGDLSLGRWRQQAGARQP
jgi:hypothetical protein